MTIHKNTKCATIALLGVPNSGKSTLLNSILGLKVAAVHRKPQMTRKNQLGIFTEKNCQLIFIDTPGIHRSDKKLNQKMLQELHGALEESHVVAVLIETNYKIPVLIDDFLRDTSVQTQKIIVLNKIDLPQKEWKIKLHDLDDYKVPVFYLSALQNEGVSDLLSYLVKEAPEHPFFYDSDDLTTTNWRDIAADCIREKIMEYTHDELPYEAQVIVEKFDESQPKIKIKALIVLNKKSQKGIVLGRSGTNIARIRKAAEKEFSKMIERPVTVNLFVKVDEGWIKSDKKIDEYML